jgi:hypothetical protein
MNILVSAGDLKTLKQKEGDRKSKKKNKRKTLEK